MLKHGALLGLLAFALAACGESKEAEQEAAGKECAPAPATLSGTPTLPPGFPTPSGVTYTSQRKAGPSQIVEAYREGEIDEAFDEYKSALSGGGYSVTKDEHEEVDAEVNFEGGSSTGQVKLVQGCKDRTSVTITVRPE